MASLLVAVFLLANLAVATTRHVNGTVGGSVVLPCHLNTSTDPARLRFHWQDTASFSVLYSFNRGQEMPIHQTETYRSRTTASMQDMRSGIISVKLDNLTLADDGRSFRVYVVLFDEKGARQPLDKICPTTLNIAVPYESPSVIINEEMTTAACTTHGGFPKPRVTWKVQEFLNNSFHFLHTEDVHTTAAPDPAGRVYRINSIIDISGQKYRSVTCLIHNPTSNVTLTYTANLSGSEQDDLVWDPAVWAPVAAVPVVILILIAVVVYACQKRRGTAIISGSGDTISGSESSEIEPCVNISNGNAKATLNGGGPTNCAASGTNEDATAGASADGEEQTKLLNNSVGFGKENGETGTAGSHQQGQPDGL